MEYVIGGKTYTQEKLTMGQAEQLFDLIETMIEGGKQLPSLTVASIVKGLGTDLYKAVAIALREKGVERWWEKDLDEMATYFKWHMDIETGATVVADFLACNLGSSLLSRVNGLVAGLAQATTKLLEQEKQTHSQASLLSSPGETSPGGTTSDGA